MKRTEIKTGVVYAWSRDANLSRQFASVTPVVVLDTETLWMLTSNRTGWTRPRNDELLVKPTVSRQESNDEGFLVVRARRDPTPELLTDLLKVSKDDVVGRTYGEGHYLHDDDFEITTVMSRQIRGEYTQIAAELAAHKQEFVLLENTRLADQQRRYERVVAVRDRLVGIGVLDPSTKVHSYNPEIVLNLAQIEELTDRVISRGTTPSTGSERD